jgi:hypothetical protein
MIFLTLDEGLSAMDPATLSPAGRVRFAQVLRGVKAEAEFFRATHGDALPMPLSIDYLASAIQVVDGPTFAASDEPVTLSWAAIEQIDDAVAAMPAHTQESIQAAWAVLDPHLGDDIVLNFNERFTRNGLRALEKTESAESLPEGLTALSEMMDEFMSHGC